MSYDKKTAVLASLIREKSIPFELLVVGCGTGEEAAVLARMLGARVTGVDIRDRFLAEAKATAELSVQDATKLSFPDGRFDFVYSFHVLEHISAPERAISEMHRVLKPGGGICVGTPNRARLIGYLGSARATTAQKFARNLKDWRAMASGRFRNELGAHAGFTSRELAALLDDKFEQQRDVTLDYYRRLYGWPQVLQALVQLRVEHRVLPAVYMMARKQQS